MKKFIINWALCSLVFFSFVQLSPAMEVITQEVWDEQVITSVDLIKTADNFIILFDASSSMNKKVPGTDVTYVSAAKQILRERNAMFPDLGYNAGLYLYTPFKEVYMVQRYDREKFAQAIEQLPDTGSGPTLLQSGLHKVRGIVEGLSGKTVVFIFTDGTVTSRDSSSKPSESTDPDAGQFIGKRPVEIAREIAAQHNVSFIVVSTAEGRTAEQVNEAVASVNAYSRVIPFERYYNRPDYMPGILFDVVATSVVKLTPRQEVVGYELKDVLFGFNSAEISMDQANYLDKLADFLNTEPSAYVVVDGYADSVGDDEYNMQLSRKRAEAVVDYLANQRGIDQIRLVPQWYGELNPKADNSTEEGRSLNRRAEISIGGI